jgi:hypothetical protein
MTPKEKAEELFEKFNNVDSPYLENFGMTFTMAKRCALISVDEILKANELNYLFTNEQINCMEGTSDDRWIYETYMEYWQQVKNEIEKL